MVQVEELCLCMEINVCQVVLVIFKHCKSGSNTHGYLYFFIYVFLSFNRSFFLSFFVSFLLPFVRSFFIVFFLSLKYLFLSFCLSLSLNLSPSLSLSIAQTFNRPPNTRAPWSFHTTSRQLGKSFLSDKCSIIALLSSLARKSGRMSHQKVCQNWMPH